MKSKMKFLTNIGGTSFPLTAHGLRMMYLFCRFSCMPHVILWRLRLWLESMLLKLRTLAKLGGDDGVDVLCGQVWLAELA